MLKKVNQKGTMLVEAMAMLGLIAMVTPILYKKAAERTTELQDINAANQLRALSSAMDSYLKDNYAKILRGETVVNSCTPKSVAYNEFALDENGAPLGTGLVTFDMSHLCEYLPYGFIDTAGVIQDSKLFSNATNSFKMAVKMDSAAVDNAHTLTGFFAVLPKDYSAFSPARSSRVATMVGSNGGYIDSTGTAMGAQGIWSVANPAANLGLAGLRANSFVVSSLQPISSQGLANEDVLHRKHEPQNNDILNTMETDLYMGYADSPANIRLVNQIIMQPMVERMAGNPDAVDPYTKLTKGLPKATANSTYEADLKYALYIGNAGGSYIEGVLAVMDSIFTVDKDGISYYKTKAGTTDPVTGKTTPDTKDSAVFNVTAEKMEYGNIAGSGGTGDASSLLFRVSNDGEFLEYNASDYKDAATGSTKTGGKVIYANKEQFAAGSGILNVTSADGKAEHAANNWSGQADAWSTVVGGGDAHRGAYTEYGYDGNGTAVNEGVDAAVQDFALTVNGPAFVKDTLQVGKLKARDVDAAVLRAGSDPANFHNAKLDKDFYSVAKKDHFIVGNVDTANLDDGDNYPKLMIGNEGVLETGVNEGIVMRHDQGVDFLAGEGAKRMLTRNDGDYKLAQYTEDQLPQDGVIRMIAQNELMLGSAGGVDVGVVSVQETMLRAYTDTGAPKTYDTIDSVLDRYNVVSDINHLGIDPYLRPVLDMGSDDAAMTVMDMMFSIQAVEAKTSRPVVDISPTLKNDFLSSKFTGGFAIYDHDDQYGAVTADANLPEDKAALYVSKGTFEVRTTSKDDTANFISSGEKIFQVDNNSNEVIIPDDDTSLDADGNKRKGSVYVRRGAINLATDRTITKTQEHGRIEGRLSNEDIGEVYKNAKQPIGYVAADRFISHAEFSPNAARATLAITGANAAAGAENATSATLYRAYEVNPAYTSVMHDIKLTTRGGARLSDILPDFINKGIYVVDNTLNPAGNWSSGNPPANDNEVTSAEVEASAWLGFIPTPQCPPLYSKVITINPSGFSMAQAGTPGAEFKKKTPSMSAAPKNRDINTHNNPSLYYYDTAGNLRETTPDADAPMPLTFQKNTWLKAMVVPKCGAGYDYTSAGICNDSGNAFEGWGAVMGFIYPEQHYPELSGAAGHKDTTATGSNRVFWNLYPVYYRQLEAYATVYCYFNRKAQYDGSDAYDSDLVDTKYDQLNSATRRTPHNKRGATNLEGLNDPALIYNDPW